MATIKVTCDDGNAAKVYVDGELVRHAVSLSLGMDARSQPVFVLQELVTEHGAYRRTTEWTLGTFTLEAEPIE